jgi:EpsI family protein
MRSLWLLAALFAAQTIATRSLANWERPPAAPELAAFAPEVAGWRVAREDPLSPDVVAALRADRLVSQTYSNSAGEAASLFVAWFQSQRSGASQPHSPKVCLPAGGWLPESSDEMTLATSRGPILVNRLSIGKGNERAIALYWYQTSHRVTAGEWAAKLWTVADALTTHRTDTALVRVVTFSTSRDRDRAALTTASSFASAVYPLLRDKLP